VAKRKVQTIKQKPMGYSAKPADNLLFNSMLVVLTLLPLIVHAVQVQIYTPLFREPMLSSGLQGDVYVYYKFLWLGAGTTLLLGLFVYKIFFNGYQIPASYINLPLAVLALLVALSGLAAKYKFLALFGQYSRYEGTLTYLFYFVLFFIAANLRYSPKRLKLLVYTACPLVIVNLYLGMIGFYGYFPLDIPFLQKLVLGDAIGFKEFLRGYFNTTLENQDFMSGIGGVFTVLFLTQAALTAALKDKAIYLVFAVLSFAMLLSATATSGFLAFLLSLPLILFFVFVGKERRRGSKTILIAILAFSLVFTVLNSHDRRVWDKTLGFIAGFGNSKVLTGSSAGTTQAGSSVQGLTTGTAEELELPPRGWAAGSGRLYIWRKTLDLIKARPVLGYGLDTLPYFFPQDDIGKISGLNDPFTIVDKPHNMYLGLVFGSGIFALLAFLVLLVQHFRAVITFFRCGMLEGEQAIMLASLSTALWAYLIQGFVNDSVISTGPFFWVFLGVSVSLLRQVMNQLKDN